jgi:hypothetical protein
MRVMIRPFAVLCFVASMQCGTIGFAVAQYAPAAHPPVPGATPPSYSGPGWGPEEEMPPATPEATQPPTDLPVLYITSVEILRASAEPELDVVRVTGLAASEGWSDPQLVPTYAGKPFDGILDLELIATPPDQSENAGGFVRVSAILPLDPSQGFKGVRVRGSENAIAVKQIPGSGQATISVNDCASCVGKKFVPEGNSLQSQQGAIRQMDLPKLLRVVKASDGIRGTEQDPNRLTLILDDDNTILEAFWE